MVMTATLDTVALARLITKHAYKAGASIVTSLFADEESALIRFRNASDASFDAAPVWFYEGMAQRCGAPCHRRQRSVASFQRGSRESEPPESGHVEGVSACP